MSKLVELQQERAWKIEAQKKLVTTRKESETKEFTDEQRAQFDNLQSEIETLDRKIKEEKDIAEFEKRQAEKEGEPQKQEGKKRQGGEEKEKSEIFARASIGKAIRNDGVLDGAEKELD